ncbi:hypothetical protein JOM56_013482 [Amanita muscaria]
MFELVRGGTRGGQAEFKWTDYYYQCPPVGARWQKNKDIQWYSRDQQPMHDGRDKEIRQGKEREANTLPVSLCVTKLCSIHRLCDFRYQWNQVVCGVGYRHLILPSRHHALCEGAEDEKGHFTPRHARFNHSRGER